MARAVDAEHDFAGWLADVLARVAARKGSDALTAGRPGRGKPAWSTSSSRARSAMTTNTCPARKDSSTMTTCGPSPVRPSPT